MEKLEKLTAHFGSQVKMANALGVSESAVSQWLNKGGLPAGRAVQIEIMTKGEFKAVDFVLINED